MERKIQLLKKLDVLLRWLFGLMAFGIFADVVLIFVNLVLPGDPRVLVAINAFFCMQTSCTSICYIYQLVRLYRAVARDSSKDPKLSKVKKTLKISIAIGVIMGSPTGIYFAILLGPLNNFQGAWTTLTALGIMFMIHFSSVLVSVFGKARAKSKTPMEAKEPLKHASLINSGGESNEKTSSVA